MSHLPLDARAILEYLNELGYRNISAHQLKEFMKDLRKLIKYEERLGVNANQDDYYEGLFRRTTASYRAKIDKENEKSKNAKSTLTNQHGRKCEQENDGHPVRAVLHERRLDGTSNGTRRGSRLRSPEASSSHMHVRRCSREKAHQFGPQWRRQEKEQQQQKTENPKVVSQLQQNKASANTLPAEKPRGRSRQRSAQNERQTRTSKDRSEGSSKGTRSHHSGSHNRKPNSSDPVALYHYYQREWRHFRQQIPGENSQSKVRWQIRNKLIGMQ